MIILFLAGYYTPMITKYPAWLPLLGIGILLLAAGRRVPGAVAVFAASFLLGTWIAREGTGGETGDLPTGVWSLEVLSGNTGGVLLEAPDGGTLWLEGNKVARCCSRGDTLHVLGRASGGFMDACAFRVSRSGNPWDVVRRSLHGTITERISSRPTSSLISALLTGERGGLTRELREIFRSTGTSHLLALSGLHVGMLATAILMILRKLFGKGWTSLIGALFVCGVYTLISGARPSTVRAWIMLVMAATFWWKFGRSPGMLSAWSAAVVVMVLAWGRGILEDPGAQMSFAAVLSLLLLGRWKTGGGNLLLSAGHAGLVVTICLAPLISHLYGVFNLLAPLATLVSIPFMLAVMFLGVPVLLFHPPAALENLSEWTVYLWLEILKMMRNPGIAYKGWMAAITVPMIFLLWFTGRRMGFFRRFR